MTKLLDFKLKSIVIMTIILFYFTLHGIFNLGLQREIIRCNYNNLQCSLVVRTYMISNTFWVIDFIMVMLIIVGFYHITKREKSDRY